MTTAAQLGILDAAMQASDATMPKAVIAAIATRDKLAAAVTKIPSGSQTDVMNSVMVAMVAGRDPLLDADVMRQVVARSLAGPGGDELARGVQRAAETLIVDAITENLDDILAALKMGMDRAGEQLSSAQTSLGDLDLDDAVIGAKLGGAAGSAWTGAREAAKVVRIVDRAWWALAEMTSAMSSNEPATLRIADVSVEQYDALGRQADAWAIVRAGATISMATRVSIKERVARVADERQQRNANAPTFEDGYRQHAGVGRTVGVA